MVPAMNPASLTHHPPMTAAVMIQHSYGGVWERRQSHWLVQYARVCIGNFFVVGRIGSLGFVMDLVCVIHCRNKIGWS